MSAEVEKPEVELTEDDLILAELIQRANNKEFSEVFKIGTYDQYVEVYKYVKSIKQVIKDFKRLYKNCYSVYLDHLKHGEHIPELFIMALQAENCIRFYTLEYENVNGILLECCDYVKSGHLIDFILENPREDSE